MNTITANNSNLKAVRFFENGGNSNDVIVYAQQRDKESEPWELWFEIGQYTSMKAAQRWASKKMAKLGYKFTF